MLRPKSANSWTSYQTTSCGRYANYPTTSQNLNLVITLKIKNDIVHPKFLNNSLNKLSDLNWTTTNIQSIIYNNNSNVSDEPAC